MERTGELKSYYDGKHRAYGAAPGADNAHAKILELTGEGLCILDVGCGAGHLGAALRERGNHVVGLELSEAAAAEARARLDEVVVGSLAEPELPLRERSFDVILCADVLEHVFDPLAALLSLRRYLEPGGRFIVSLPNVAHFSMRWQLLRGRWEYREIGILDHGHVRFFTRKSAERLLQDAGLRVTALEIATSLPDAPPLARRIIDFCRRLSPALKQRLAGLIAVQLVFVAEPRPEDGRIGPGRRSLP